MRGRVSTRPPCYVLVRSASSRATGGFAGRNNSAMKAAREGVKHRGRVIESLIELHELHPRDTMEAETWIAHETFAILRPHGNVRRVP